jgi:hypothetical protein
MVKKVEKSHSQAGWCTEAPLTPKPQAKPLQAGTN